MCLFPPLWTQPPLVEGPASGNDALPALLPAIDYSLNEIGGYFFNPTVLVGSWLTITGVTNGVTSFSFTANTTGSARTGSIGPFGQTIPITQYPMPTLTSATMPSQGVIQFAFSNALNMSFTVLSATNLSLPLTNWTAVGSATNIGPGLYQFISQPTTNNPQRFYALRSP
jgi:hypothetical protein